MQHNRNRRPLKYFDLITQNCFDIFSHLKFVEPFKGAIIGPTEEAILVQYRKGTGCPSPGIRFLLRTKPGAVYCVSVEGFLHKGHKAIFFIESINPKLKIVPKEDSFTPKVKEKFSLNFRAVSDLTSMGIVFDSAKHDYCLAITDLKVRKFDECLLPTGGCDNTNGSACGGQGPCHDFPYVEPSYPSCVIDDPPTVRELCPNKPQPDCLDKPKPHKPCHKKRRRKIDFCGKVVDTVQSTDCYELGDLVLETSTCKLWICDGQQLVPFQSQLEEFLFRDKKCNGVWKVNGDKCRRIR